MSKRKHPSRQQAVTRRYIERTVRRARDEIIRAVIVSDRLRGYDEPPHDALPLHRFAASLPIQSGHSGLGGICPACGGSHETMSDAYARGLVDEMSVRDA